MKHVKKVKKAKTVKKEEKQTNKKHKLLGCQEIALMHLIDSES